MLMLWQIKKSDDAEILNGTNKISPVDMDAGRLTQVTHVFIKGIGGSQSYNEFLLCI